METNRFTLTKFLPASVLFCSAAYLSIFKGAALSDSFLACLSFSVTGLFTFLLGLVTGILAFQPISQLHSPLTAILHFSTNAILPILGKIYFKKIIDCTQNVKQTQEKWLLELLDLNKDTEYGRKLNIGSINSREEFRDKVPLSTFSDYKDYIDRIALGEDDILTKMKVIRFGVSSGTTGKCKLLPVTEMYEKHLILNFFMPLIYRHYVQSSPFLPPLKTLELTYVPRWRYTDKGHPIGPVSASPKPPPFLLTLGQSTPAEARAVMPEPAQTYIHLYYALYDKDLFGFMTHFAGTMVAGLQFLRRNWKLLVNDIRDGRVSNLFDIPTEVYYHMKSCPPNPERAREIEDECLKGFENIIPRLWPRLRIIFAITTGSHAIFRKSLQYYTGDIPTLSSLYASSESLIASAISKRDDIEKCYTLLPNWAFFELIPEDEVDSENPSTVFLEQAEVGKLYEVVVTSATSGFYRYRLGDMARIAYFNNQAPAIDFCTRIGGLLDVKGEKTTEEMVLGALQKTTWPDNSGIVEYSTTDSVSLSNAIENNSFEEGLYYVLFIEFEAINRLLDDSEVSTFDEVLGNISYPYKSFRVKDAIQKPKIFVMKPGTFQEFKKFILTRNGSISNQYKTPRYTTNVDLIRMLYQSSY